MKSRINRRDFVTSTTIGALVTPGLLAFAQAPQAITRRTTKPIVISAANGNVSKDAEGLTCVARAFKMITAGADVLDAVVAGALAPLLVHALSDGRRSAVVCPAPRQPGASDRPGHPRLAAQASDKLMDYVESFTRATVAV